MILSVNLEDNKSNIEIVAISFVLVIAVYVVYWKGPVLRHRSPFAQQLSERRSEKDASGHRLAKLNTTDEEKAAGQKRPSQARSNSYARQQQHNRVLSATGSSRATPQGSRRNSSEHVQKNNFPDLNAAALAAEASRNNEKAHTPYGSKRTTPIHTPTLSRNGSYNDAELHSKALPTRGHANRTGSHGAALTTIESAM